jgi:hypothetical protein
MSTVSASPLIVNNSTDMPTLIFLTVFLIIVFMIFVLFGIILFCAFNYYNNLQLTSVLNIKDNLKPINITDLKPINIKDPKPINNVEIRDNMLYFVNISDPTLIINMLKSLQDQVPVIQVPVIQAPVPVIQAPVPVIQAPVPVIHAPVPQDLPLQVPALQAPPVPQDLPVPANTIGQNIVVPAQEPVPVV